MPFGNSFAQSFWHVVSVQVFRHAERLLQSLAFIHAVTCDAHAPVFACALSAHVSQDSPVLVSGWPGGRLASCVGVGVGGGVPPSAFGHAETVSTSDAQPLISPTPASVHVKPAAATQFR